MRRQNTRSWLRLSLLLCVAVAINCDPELSEPVKQFLEIPIPERPVAILQYSPEAQVELYVEAMRRTHPSDKHLSVAVASNGSAIVPALLERIEREDLSNRSKVDVLRVFALMQHDGHYSVVADREVMKVLERQVEMMKGQRYGSSAAIMLEWIRPQDGQAHEQPKKREGDG